MIEKIFRTLFEKKVTSNCITVLKERQNMGNSFELIEKQIKIDNSTCLSDYFKHRKGLNTVAREKFYSVIFNAGNRQ